jgi:hypothetical protein
MDGNPLEREDKEIEGQVLIVLYTDNTFSIGTSVDLETTLDCLVAAANGIVDETMTGIDEMKAFSGKLH